MWSQFISLFLQVDSFKQFTQEADAIDSHIASCRRLLPEFDKHLNSEELDVMSKKQNMLAAMIESYEKKVASFVRLSDKLNPEMHIRYEECKHRKDAIAQSWDQLNEEFNTCNQKIQVRTTTIQDTNNKSKGNRCFKIRKRLVF